jgi:capsular exopolysaccharide synthesis family protein
MELRDLFALAWKRRIVIAIVFVCCMLAASAYAFTQPKRYESVATIAFTPNVKGGNYLPAENLNALLSTYAQVAKSSQTKNAARELLGHKVGGTISTSTTAGSGILEVIDVSTSPAEAAAGAHAIAQALVNSLKGNELLTPNIVNPPVESHSPVQPRPKLILSVAAVLGLLLGFLLALALGHLRPTAESAAELAEITGLPVIGSLQRERALPATQSLVWGSEELYLAQEAFRTLRTNVELLIEQQPAVIQVTSAEAGQGKSTVVANLAIALGQIDIPTTIVDADLRNPRQHMIFEMSNDVGLSTAMMLPKSETKPRATGYENVSLLTSGPLPPNAQEMLHIRFRSVLANLRAAGGVILVDSTPVLPVSDSRLIARHADAVIFVVAQGRTRTSEITSALEKLRFAQANVVGLLLNFAGRDGDVAGSYRYGTYGTYGGYSGYNAALAGNAPSEPASRVEVSDTAPESRRSRRQRARDAARREASEREHPDGHNRSEDPAASEAGAGGEAQASESRPGERQHSPGAVRTG